jgi:hypothetical protein
MFAKVVCFKGSLSSFCMHRYRSRIFVPFWAGLQSQLLLPFPFPLSPFPIPGSISCSVQFSDFRDRLFDSPPPPYSSGDVPALLTLSTLPPPSMGCSGWSMLLLLSI